MVTSDTQIVNMACDRLGVETIDSLNDNTPTAELMKRLYAPQRDSLLVETPWNFAMKRVELSKLVAAPEFEYTSKFQLPADFLKVHRIFDSDPTSGTGNKHPYDTRDYSGVYYEIEGTELLGDFDRCFLVYISRITDVSKYSPDFVEALWLRLAAAASYKLTQDKTLKNQLIEEADYYVRRSAALSAQQDIAYEDEVKFRSFINPRMI